MNIINASKTFIQNHHHLHTNKTLPTITHFFEKPEKKTFKLHNLSGNHYIKNQPAHNITAPNRIRHTEFKRKQLPTKVNGYSKDRPLKNVNAFLPKTDPE